MIVAKGVLFALLAAGAGALVIVESPTLRTVLALAICLWASCRFYYFLFHVLEKWVDPRLRYTGLWDLIARAWRRR